WRPREGDTFFRRMKACSLVFLATVALAKKMPPHIVFILADDLGWDDVSFHGSSQIPTPNIDVLAADGITLHNYYVQPMCTPSRAALMTGLYPIRTGMQHWVIRSPEPWGLPLELKLMPEHLKDLGYSTHLVGKWHLGYFKKEYTPTHRGFDTFYGYYNGYIDYYSHVNEYKSHAGLDFRNGEEPFHNDTGQYATTLFTDRAISIIEQHNQTKPLFLYLSHLAPHGATQDEPLQAPDENVDKFDYIGEEDRTIYAGMVDALDVSVGRVVEALSRAGMLENSIVAFSSDNGAVPFGFRSNRGFNWPLRGIKASVWEGGVRVPGFVWSPLLRKSARLSTQMMHITDWLPTLYAAAGGNTKNLGQLDGHNMWEALSRGWRSPRTEILLNIDPITGSAGLRFGKHKLLIPGVNGTTDAHVPTTGYPRPTEDMDTMMQQSLAAKVLRRFYNVDGIWFRRGWENTAEVDCGPAEWQSNFVSGRVYNLFDIERDPCEMINLAATRRGTVRMMMRKLQSYAAAMIPPRNKEEDPRSFPENHGGVWTTWLA
ncbi:unnamed protein product, partial [Ixodes pacificus]